MAAPEPNGVAMSLVQGACCGSRGANTCPLVHERPQQLPALFIQLLRLTQLIQIAGEVTDQESAVRQRPWPIIQSGLKEPRPLPRLDAPVPDLDFFIDLQHARHLEDEPRNGERRFERRAGARAAVPRRGAPPPPPPPRPP